MNFITWLSRRFINGIIAVPKSVYRFWREMLLDTRLGGTLIALFLLLIPWIGGCGIMAAFNVEGWLAFAIWTGIIVLIPIGTIIEYQYQIYRREVTSSFNALKNKNEPW